MYLVVSHNKQTKFTKVQLGGKYNTTVKGKKLNEDGVWPLALICTDLQIKIEVMYDAQNNIFTVRIQGEPYHHLPYIAPNSNYSSD